MAGTPDLTPANFSPRPWVHPDEAPAGPGSGAPSETALNPGGNVGRLRSGKLLDLRELKMAARRRARTAWHRRPGVHEVVGRIPRQRRRGRHDAPSAPVDRDVFNAVGFSTDDDGKILDLVDLVADAGRPERMVRRVHRARFVRFVEVGAGMPTMLELGLAGAVIVDSDQATGSTSRLAALAATRASALVSARDRELHSIRVRRAARRLIGSDAAGRSISIVLATNRPMLLEHAIRSIAAQSIPAHQVLIGMHGPGWSEAHVDLAHELLGAVVSVDRFENAVPFGQVLQTLSEGATGELLTKWDDDDWYGTHHLEDLVGALDDSGADLVGKAAEFVRLESMDLTIRRFASGAERYSTTLAGGTLLLRTATLLAVGGWAPVPRHVDRRLIEAVEQGGGVAYRTHGFEYLLRRAGQGHTWNADDRYFLGQACAVRPGLDLSFCGFDG